MKRKGFPMNWADKLEENYKMIGLYCSYMPQAGTFEKRIRLAQEITRLGSQAEFIQQMQVSQFLNEKDFYTTKMKSIINNPVLV